MISSILAVALLSTILASLFVDRFAGNMPVLVPRTRLTVEISGIPEFMASFNLINEAAAAERLAACQAALVAVHAAERAAVASTQVATQLAYQSEVVAKFNAFAAGQSTEIDARTLDDLDSPRGFMAELVDRWNRADMTEFSLGLH